MILGEVPGGRGGGDRVVVTLGHRGIVGYGRGFVVVAVHADPLPGDGDDVGGEGARGDGAVGEVVVLVGLGAGAGAGLLDADARGDGVADDLDPVIRRGGWW